MKIKYHDSLEAVSVRYSPAFRFFVCLNKLIKTHL